MTPDPYANSGAKTRNAVIAAVVGALVVGGLAGVFGSRLLSRTAGAPDTGALAKTGQAPAPILEKTAVAPTPTLDRTARAPRGMPADVRAWLEHLERIEAKRGELSRRGVSQILVMMPSANMGTDLQGLKDLVNGATDPMNETGNAPEPRTSADRVGDATAEMRTSWRALLNEYDAARPPASLRPLAESYRNALRETADMIGDLTGAIAGSSADPTSAITKLQGMKGASARIDGYGKRADAELGRVCDEFDTRKWFSISSDFGGGGMLDKF